MTIYRSKLREVAGRPDAAYLPRMGKPVEIDEDLVRAAERIAAETDTTPGRVISDFARRAMSGQISVDDLPMRHGFRFFPKRGGVVTPELVKRLAEDEF